jgi:hypothetical protein
MSNANRFLKFVSLLLAILAVPPVLRSAEPSAPDADKLTAVLGANADKWKITPAPVFTGEAGNITMAAPTGQALSLESVAPQTAPVELTATFRMAPPSPGSTYVQAQMACATLPDKTAQALNLSVSSAAATPYISYSGSLQGPKEPPPVISGALYLQAITERSLAWTEEMRVAVDSLIASTPKLEDTVFTLRCTLEKDRARFWVNGRYAGQMALGAETVQSGLVRFIAAPGSRLTSLQVRPLVPVSRQFEPLSIGGNLNSAELDGQKIDRASLPTGAVNGVPFEFPTPSQNGSDHIDVSTSWMRFGALPGWFPANCYMFGGRWTCTDRLDPARICQYIPPGRYKALHLITIADGRKDSVPIVSAQFYRPDAGHPFNFEGMVPALRGRGGEGKPVDIKLANGKRARLYHTVIPLDPDAFSWFSDLPRVGLEITKEVQYYRGYPDPLEYSRHGAGLPSSVQIYAMTLERANVDVDLQPDTFGHVWTAPAQPVYNLQFRNGKDVAAKVKLTVTNRSHDGRDVKTQEQSVTLPPSGGAPVKVPITLRPTLYGLHEVTVVVDDGHDTATYRRQFAFLHPDTRDHTTWQDGRGPIFGGWFWGGGHNTPTSLQDIPVMAAAGAETSTANYSIPLDDLKKLEADKTPAGVAELKRRKDIEALAEKYHFVSEAAFGGASMYVAGYCAPVGGAINFDPAKPDECAAKTIETLKKMKHEPGTISRPTYLPFFAEPQIGPVTMGTWPGHWGVDYKLTPDEERVFADMKAKFMATAKAARKEWPDIKLLLPYGDPMNTAIFLKLYPESRPYIDGAALDLPGFERLPEQQIHQVVLSRLYSITKDIREFKPNPYYVLIEGTCIGSIDIDTGEVGQAEIGIRNFLVLMGYGIYRFESSNAPFDCANYWGENHYGGGWCTRLPVAMPKLGYVQYATISRHLNRANFVKYVTTGSTSVYCQQYKHYKTGKLIHVLWTIRGTRPVTVKADPGATLELYDPQDNVTKLPEKNGAATFTIGTQPVYLEGLTAEAQITLGESDHSDAKVAAVNKRLGNLSSWNLVEKEDAEYAHNKPLQIERFLGKMTAQKVEAPGAQGGKALAVHLEKQETDRGVMPFYTTIEPGSAVTIPGKASHLGLWVHAASDWGRVVYVLRDAKNEKWVSVGTKEEWNNDDVHCWSAFCFDGWRYLRFELPSSAPYDCYREYGTSWWGSYGGDGIVDLPLKLEKVLVERRPKAVYGNDLVETRTDDVLLGDLYAEYAKESDRGDEAVRLSRLRMPLPSNAPPLANPITDLVKTGVGPATTVLKVVDPLREYDGTRCHVHFTPVPDAKGYDIWVSPYPDGRGAMQLGKDWKESGGLITGLRPDLDFYVFVVYTDKDGKLSKPSEPLKFLLKDRFGYK